MVDYDVTVVNGKTIRNVKPYIYVFKTFAKGRWIGRELMEVLTKEFGGQPESYWHNAVKKGFIIINGKPVSGDYKFKNSDAFVHRTHRHEPPVFGSIDLVGESEHYLAVSKPHSLPMHPCGAYRYNSLEHIMRNEPIVANQPPLFVVHRLDRVTSGLVVLAKSKEAAAVIATSIREKSTKKVYLARVRGRFPGRLSHLAELPSIDFNCLGGDEGDEETEGGKQSAGDDREMKKRKTEGVAGAATDRVSSGDAGACDRSESVCDTPGAGTAVVRIKAKDLRRQQHQQKASRQSRQGVDFGSGRDIRVDDLPVLLPAASPEEVGRAPNVGYCYLADSEPTTVTAATNEGLIDTEKRVLWLQCPIGVVSFRDGIHACDPAGKASLSGFRFLGYCAETDTSLVECRPYSGRTHQLRLHLQLLGSPIANDPCYGGELFYGDEERRRLALEVLRAMRADGATPLSKVPHLADPEAVSGAGGGNCDDACNTTSSSSSSSSSSSGDQLASLVSATVEKSVVEEEGDLLDPLPGESADEYLVRTCRFCRGGAGALARLEHLLHCDGVWLHALRYSGSGWSFETRFPDWAQCFRITTSSSEV